MHPVAKESDGGRKLAEENEMAQRRGGGGAGIGRLSLRVSG